MKSKITSVMILSMLFIAGRYLWNRTNDPAPAGMVLIPAGEFIMGTDETGYSVDPVSILPNKPLLKDERPAHAVYLETFAIDRTKVRNRDYRKFCDRRRSLPSPSAYKKPIRTNRSPASPGRRPPTTANRLRQTSSDRRRVGKSGPGHRWENLSLGKSIRSGNRKSGPDFSPRQTDLLPLRRGSDGRVRMGVDRRPLSSLPQQSLSRRSLPGKTSAPSAGGSEAINPARFVS
ncbi:MAG: SUMF1/EgtB/PvdO family nonheme iron enzyme [Candidatus Manganitrophus sp.]|nr:SUMF1/EgtB/PvdO family nonheme iron enzyme [Candidatus Manganitrophus sp.]